MSGRQTSAESSSSDARGERIRTSPMGSRLRRSLSPEIRRLTPAARARVMNLSSSASRHHTSPLGTASHQRAPDAIEWRNCLRSSSVKYGSNLDRHSRVSSSWKVAGGKNQLTFENKSAHQQGWDAACGKCRADDDVGIYDNMPIAGRQTALSFHLRTVRRVCPR